MEKEFNVTFKVNKTIYYNFRDEFKVLSCQPISNQYDNGFQLNKYKSFTISGSNLTPFVEQGEYSLKLRLDQRAKYPASYVVVGYQGVEIVNEDIKVDPKTNRQILGNLMTDSQADYVQDAYPNFVELVLTGHESEIEHKNIYNVGKVRIEEYIDKVKNNCRSILFYPIFGEWKINDNKDVDTLTKNFQTPNQLKESLDNSPYHILVNMLGWGFIKADKMVLKNRPELMSSLERCEFACMEILEENELEGDTRINANLLYRMVKEIAPECIDHIIEAVTNSDFIYYEPERKYAALESTYQAELNIAENIKKRLAMNTNELNNWQEFTEVDGFQTTDEQQEIMRLAGRYGVALLTGGAGVGKTSSIKALIRLLENNNKSYTLLAPTGVASKRMRESTGRPASTIHRYLATRSADSTSTDFVLIDEMSMVSVKLLSDLLDGLTPNAKIIFIADEAQLASIACGNIIQDILDSGIVPTARLTKVFRYGEGGIATIATDVRYGKADSFTQQFEDYTYLEANDNVIEQVTEQYGELREKGYNINDILVICPFNKSHIGTYVINNAIQTRFNANPYTGISYKRDNYEIKFKKGDKVINKKNNYKMPVVELTDNMTFELTEQNTFIANGDMGIIRDYMNEGENVYLIVDFEGTMVMVTGSDICNLLLGYAISIHSSQGSQGKAVIILIDESHKSLLTRNLVYVAVSRAQKELMFIGNVNSIKDGIKIEENKQRDTYLKELLLTNP